MSFEIVKAETRLGRVIVWLAGIQKKITDFQVGGKTRTKLEAVCVEMEKQDLAFYSAIRKAIPTSIYAAFDFSLIPPVRASGNVTFTASPTPASDLSIPAGTQVSTQGSPERVYETTQDGTIPAGQSTVTLPVSCLVSGASGNTGAGTIVRMKTTVSGVVSVTNPSALTNGQDKETEEERRLRFQDYVAALKRGTADALSYGARTARLLDAGGNVLESVVDAIAVDTPHVSAGFAEVYIYNGTGSTSSELVAEAQKILDGYTDAGGNKVPGYKAAGVVCTVRGVTEIPLAVTAAVDARQGYDTSLLQTRVTAALNAYIESLSIGENAIRNEIIERIMALDGVYDVYLTLPAANEEAVYSSAVTFTGTGLDDLVVSGTYAAGGHTDYVVEIDGTGTPNTFRWSRDGGTTWTKSAVAITGSAQGLSAGVDVTLATTGHTLGDRWAFTRSRAVVFIPGTYTVVVT